MKLSTENPDIYLRKLALSDAKDLAKIANNRNIWLYVRDAFPYPYSLKDAIIFIEKLKKETNTYVFGIFYKDALVGVSGLHEQKDIYKHSTELGYFLSESYWGKGIATIVVRRIVQFGFENLNLQRIFATVFESNPASCRVLEKCGFTLEGIKKKGIFKDDVIMDEYFYGITKE